MLMAAASLAVLALGVYVFIEVRSAPAAVTASTVHVAETVHSEEPTSAPAASDDPPPKKVRKATVAEVAPPPEAPTAAREVPEAGKPADPNLDALMDEANKAYDKQEFEDARSIANRVLAKQPNNVRMLRVLVSAACVETDNAEAQKWYAKLPEGDKASMRTRCTRYGVTFPDAK